MSRSSIGFDRALQPEWLDLAATIAMDGSSTTEARAKMLSELQDQFSGPEALAKAVLVIQRIWFPTEHLHLQLRDDVMRIIKEVTPPERLALHWALTMVAYPFFYNSLEVIGRITRLQGQFTGVQVQRRLVEEWGDRSIIDRARQHVLQTLVWWDVLRLVSRRGTYELGSRIQLVHLPVERALLQASIMGSAANELSLDEALLSPALFPFDIEHSTTAIAADERFTVFTSGGGRRTISLE